MFFFFGPSFVVAAVVFTRDSVATVGFGLTRQQRRLGCPYLSLVLNPGSNDLSMPRAETRRDHLEPADHVCLSFSGSMLLNANQNHLVDRIPGPCLFQSRVFSWSSPVYLRQYLGPSC